VRQLRYEGKIFIAKAVARELGARFGVVVARWTSAAEHIQLFRRPASDFEESPLPVEKLWSTCLRFARDGRS
jgi:hypothetical protein